MKKIDAEVISAFKKSKGSEPTAYAYMVKRPHILLMLLSAGILFAVTMKPLMVGLFADGYYCIPTSIWSTSKLKPEEGFLIAKDDIKETKFWSFGPAKYFTLIMKDGSKTHFVANNMYIKLAKQKEGLSTILKTMGINA